jgi:hypothetical protein
MCFYLVFSRSCFKKILTISLQLLLRKILLLLIC